MDHLIKKIKSPVFISLFGAIFLSCSYYIIQFLFTKIISTKLTIEEFGDYRYFFSVLSFCSVFNLGFVDGFLTEWIVNGKEINYKYIYGSCIVTLISSVFLFFLFQSAELRFLIILNIVISNLVLIFQYVFVKYNFFLFYLVQLIFSQLIQIIILSFFKLHISLLLILYIHTVINLILVLITYLYAINKKYIRAEYSRDFSIKNIGGYIKSGAPILLSSIVLIGFQNIDKLILKDQYSEIDYGYYAFGSLIALVVYGVFASLTSILFKKIVDTENINKLYNNIIYVILLIPFLAIISKGFVAKGIELVFPKFTQSNQYYIGFANFYFPLLANSMIILSVYKKKKQVMRFAIVSLFFLMLQAILLLFASKLKLKLVNIPYAMSVIVYAWFFASDFILSYYDTSLFKRYWQRTIICLLACAAVFFVTYYYR